MNLDPSTIGRYKLIGTLGSGAMGTVYLAEDPLLKRPLAIKVVREGTGDAQVMQRFQREAEVSARLSHPNAITVYDVGDEPDIGPYMVMEYVQGECLSELLKRGPLKPAQAAELLLQGGDALEAVHGLGILHRDIKSENFMVSLDGHLKLMDFGIARGDHGRLTTTDAFLGTPAYAAPEVLNGSSATASADRWSFALTAFEMLTGHLPFVGASVGAILFRIVHEPPVLPGNMAPEVQSVFLRALDKDPAKRYPDLRTFLWALFEALPLEPEERNSYLAQLAAPSSLKPTSTLRLELRTKEKPPRRTRWYWAGGLLLAALLTGGFLLWSNRGRTLSIQSDPPGAEVFLNGASLGRTPLQHVVVKGRADGLRLEKPDFLPIEMDLKKEDWDLMLQLSPAPFQVAVTSEPPGAEVLLDGELKGHAPLLLQVPGEGTHQVRLNLENHQPWSAALDRHKPLPNPIQLQKKTVAKITPKPEGKVKKFFKGIFR